MVPHGYEPEALIKAIWAGTKAMIKNDGNQTNEQAFWNCFCSILGQRARSAEPILQEYYETDFQNVQQVCGYTPDSATLIS